MWTKFPCSLVLHPNLLKINTLSDRQREKTAQILALQLPYEANPRKVKNVRTWYTCLMLISTLHFNVK